MTTSNPIDRLVERSLSGSLPLWIVDNLRWLPWLSLLWGVANLGLLKIVIAFATLSVPRPSPRLVAALLFGATTGTAVLDRATIALPAEPVTLKAGRSEQFANFQADAPSCDSCGAITVRNGNCYLCYNCGNSMGCS